MLRSKFAISLILPLLLVGCTSLASEEVFDPHVELATAGWVDAAPTYPQLVVGFNATEDTIIMFESPDRQCILVAAFDADHLTSLENSISSQPVFNGYTYWVLHSSYNEASGIVFSKYENAECITIAKNYYAGNFTENSVDTSGSDISTPEQSAAVDLFDRIQQGESAWEVKSGADASLSLQGVLYAPGPNYGTYTCETWIFDNYSAAKLASQNYIQGYGKYVMIYKDGKSNLALVVVADAIYSSCVNDIGLAGATISEYVSAPNGVSLY